MKPTKPTNHYFSNILKMAHAIRKRVASWSEALKKAWAAFKLRMAMKKGAVRFTFRKKDGSIRYANGIIKPSTGTSSRKQNFGVLVFWDKISEDYRSCRVENILNIV